MQPQNLETPYGTFKYSQNYNSDEYQEWVKNIANEFIKAVPEEGTDEDHITWLKGRAERSNDPEDQDKLQDLVIARRMLREGKVSESIYFEPLWNIWYNTVNAARKEELEKQKPVSIRGLDHNLYLEARAQAIREGKNIGEWLNETIGYRLAQVETDKAERKKGG